MAATPNFIGWTKLFIVRHDDGSWTAEWAKTRADFRGFLWRQCRSKWKQERVARRMKRLNH